MSSRFSSVRANPGKARLISGKRVIFSKRFRFILETKGVRIDLSAVLKLSPGRASESTSGVRASFTIVHIGKFYKIYKNFDSDPVEQHVYTYLFSQLLTANFMFCYQDAFILLFFSIFDFFLACVIDQ